MWLIDVQLLVEAVTKDELVSHFHSEWLHRMSGAIVNRPNTRVVKVAYFLR